MGICCKKRFYESCHETHLDGCKGRVAWECFNVDQWLGRWAEQGGFPWRGLLVRKKKKGSLESIHKKIKKGKHMGRFHNF